MGQPSPTYITWHNPNIFAQLARATKLNTWSLEQSADNPSFLVYGNGTMVSAYIYIYILASFEGVFVCVKFEKNKGDIESMQKKTSQPN